MTTTLQRPLMVYVLLAFILWPSFTPTSLSQTNNCSPTPAAVKTLSVENSCNPVNFVTRWWWSQSSYGSCSAGTQFQDGWYVLYGTGSPITVSIAGSNRDFVLAAFTDCGGVGEVACTFSNTGAGSIVFPTTYGAPYYIMINRRSGGTFNIHTGTICATSANIPNDMPCNAIPLTVGATCSYTMATNAPSSNSGNLPGCANYQGGDAWFSITVPPTGIVSMGLQEASFYNSGMAVYSGTCGSLSLIECDDDDGTGTMSAITLTGQTPGATLWIQVWEKSNDMPGGFGICVQDNASCTTPPNEDYCNAPALLTQGPGNFVSSTFPYYTSDVPGNLNGTFCGTIENNSWYQFVASGPTEVFPFSSVGNCANNDGVQAQVYEVTNGANGCCSVFNSMSNCWNPGAPGAGVVTANGLTPGNIYILMVDGYAGDNCLFQVDGWMATGIILPVEFTGLAAIALPEYNSITWKTLAERDNDYFNIQRSFDGENFVTIGTVDGAGNSSTTINYQYTDPDYKAGVTYYRIEQVDYNGFTSTSDVVTLDRGIKESGIVAMYPNPTNSTITLEISSSSNSSGSITLLNPEGRIVWNESISFHGLEKLDLNLSEYTNGVYVLVYEDTETKSVKKIIKN